MRIRYLGLAAVVILAFAGLASADPITIGFEGTGVAVGGNISPILPYSESGFVLHNGTPAAESGIYDSAFDGVPNSGSDFFGWAFHGAIVLEDETADAFTLTSFDAGHLGGLRSGPAVLTLQVTGNLQGGGSVVTSFGYTNPWATFYLPDTFTGLSSVVFLSSDNGDGAIDNIVINGTRVPDEGACLALLSLAFIGMLGLQRRLRRETV